MIGRRFEIYECYLDESRMKRFDEFLFQPPLAETNRDPLNSNGDDVFALESSIDQSNICLKLSGAGFLFEDYG